MTVARTLAEAVGLCRNRPFDLLIADLSLPDGDACELLAPGGACEKTPAIALTGHCLPEDVHHTLSVGFRQHLAKPIVVEDLLTAIERTLDTVSGDLHRDNGSATDRTPNSMASAARPSEREAQADSLR